MQPLKKSQEESSRHDKVSKVGQKLFSIIVVGTHNDDSSIQQGSEDQRREKIIEISMDCGFSEPAEYFEVSCVTMSNINTLQQHIFQAPLSHSYLGEKVPQSCVAVATTVKELKYFHKEHPIVDLNRITYYVNYIQVLQTDQIKQSLRIVNSWGDCVYYDKPEDVSDIIILDPIFFAKQVLVPLLRPETEELIEKGVLKHSNLQALWSGLSTKSFHESASKLISTLESYEVLARFGEDKSLDFLEQRSLFPHLLPVTPPPELFPNLEIGVLLGRECIWQPECPKGLVEVSLILFFSAFSREVIPRVLLRLHKANPAKLMWRYGAYFEFESVKALVEVLTKRMPDDTLQPTSQIRIAVRDENRNIARAFSTSMFDDIKELEEFYIGLDVQRVIPSPHHSETFLNLDELMDYYEVDMKMDEKPAPFRCPSTNKEVNVELLLINAGLIENSNEQEKFWWSFTKNNANWSPEMDSFTRYLFIDNGKIKDEDMAYKLRTILGDAMSNVTLAFAVLNNKLAIDFQQYRSGLGDLHRNKPDMYKKDDWTKKTDLPKREEVLARLHAIAENKSFIWNQKGRLDVLPMYLGCSEKDAWKVCSSGVGLLRNKKGNYGNGVYFTSDRPYAELKSDKVPGKGKVTVICMTLPGNANPVIEAPKRPDSYLNKGCEPGYQSHYTLVTRSTDQPIQKEFNSENDADSLVIFNDNQALPLFVIYTSDQPIQDTPDDQRKIKSKFKSFF